MGINCSLVFDQLNNGEEFLQRCKIGQLQYFDPDVCIGVVGVQCGKHNVYMHGSPYQYSRVHA